MPKAKTLDRLALTRKILAHGRVSDIPNDEPPMMDRNGGTASENLQGQQVICEECGAKLLHEAGCVRCPYCGWSRC